MIPLVSLEEAKDRLNITQDIQDPDIYKMILGASAFLLRHIKMTEADAYEAWGSPIEVPEDLQAEVLEMVAKKFLEREDADILSERAKARLDSYRTPTVG